MAEMLLTEEPNPFDELTGGEIAAFIYKKCGVPIGNSIRLARGSESGESSAR